MYLRLHRKLLFVCAAVLISLRSAHFESIPKKDFTAQRNPIAVPTRPSTISRTGGAAGSILDLVNVAGSLSGCIYLLLFSCPSDSQGEGGREGKKKTLVNQCLYQSDGGKRCVCVCVRAHGFAVVVRTCWKECLRTPSLSGCCCRKLDHRVIW